MGEDGEGRGGKGGAERTAHNHMYITHIMYTYMHTYLYIVYTYIYICISGPARPAGSKS